MMSNTAANGESNTTQNLWIENSYNETIYISSPLKSIKGLHEEFGASSIPLQRGLKPVEPVINFNDHSKVNKYWKISSYDTVVPDKKRTKYKTISIANGSTVRYLITEKPTKNIRPITIVTIEHGSLGYKCGTKDYYFGNKTNAYDFTLGKIRNLLLKNTKRKTQVHKIGDKELQFRSKISKIIGHKNICFNIGLVNLIRGYYGGGKYTDISLDNPSDLLSVAFSILSQKRITTFLVYESEIYYESTVYTKCPKYGSYISKSGTFMSKFVNRVNENNRITKDVELSDTMNDIGITINEIYQLRNLYLAYIANLK